MSEERPGRRAAWGPVLGLLMSAALLFGCGPRDPRAGGGSRGPDAAGAARVDVAAFERLAAGNTCANKTSRMVVIDESLVFWRWDGTCSDAAYGRTLYGATPERVLATEHDTIAGRVREARDPAYAVMFGVILAHLDEPRLGLGPGHSVRELAIAR